MKLQNLSFWVSKTKFIILDEIWMENGQLIARKCRILSHSLASP